MDCQPAHIPNVQEIQLHLARVMYGPSKSLFDSALVATASLVVVVVVV